MLKCGSVVHPDLLTKVDENLNKDLDKALLFHMEGLHVFSMYLFLSRYKVGYSLDKFISSSKQETMESGLFKEFSVTI